MIAINELHSWLHKHEPEIVRLLGRMVEIESPSHDKAAAGRLSQLVASEWKRRGAQVRLLRQSRCGDHVVAELRPAHKAAGRQLLVLGHLDTVYPMGTLAKMPFRVAKGRAWGPGTFDMKGGLAIALAAADAMQSRGISPRRKIVFLWTSDEEIGSGNSRMFIEREARQSHAVFVLEPAYGRDGRLKTQRKGVGEAELIVTGRSAHAGIDPESGVNAVHELALQIARLLKWNDRKRGITVQANVVEGGTVTNVVAASARALIDVRVVRLADAHALNRKLRALRPILRNAKLEVIGGINRPPMERTPGSRALFAHAQELAREMHVKLGEAATGGGSDGNLTAALGVPTLDGLGAVGDGAHSPREHILISSLSERAAILAGLLATV
ncbi:MAG: M20 family metallopeptidase [Candidatus Acidiferrales bacterium]